MKNQLYFWRVLFKRYKFFSYNLFHSIKYVCVLCDWSCVLNIHKESDQLVLLLKHFLDICTSIFAHWLNSFIYWLKWHYDFTEIFIFTYFFMRHKFFFFSKRMKTIQTLKIILTCILLSCHVRVSEWIHPLSTVRNGHSYAPYKYVLTTQLNRLASLAKWLSVWLWTKWLWVRVQLQSLKLQISRLLWARRFLTLGNYRVWIHSETRTWHDNNRTDISTHNTAQSFGQFG